MSLQVQLKEEVERQRQKLFQWLMGTRLLPRVEFRSSSRKNGPAAVAGPAVGVRAAGPAGLAADLGPDFAVSPFC